MYHKNLQFSGFAGAQLSYYGLGSAYHPKHIYQNYDA